MWDILTFHRFVTRDVLVFFYYLSAVAMPLFLYLFRGVLIRKFPLLAQIERSFQMWFKNRRRSEKIAAWLLFAVIFFCMELCWRMIFEAMIGYFDIHDNLHRILIRMPDR